VLLVVMIALLLFFSLIGVVCLGVAVALGTPVILHYLDTGQVPRFPTAILASALVVIAVLCVSTGLILDLIAHVRRESKRLAYLSYAAPQRKSATPMIEGDERHAG